MVRNAKIHQGLVMGIFYANHPKGNFTYHKKKSNWGFKLVETGDQCSFRAISLWSSTAISMMATFMVQPVERDQ